MKIYKSKFMRVLNFIKNEGKFERGDMVRVIFITNDKYKWKYEKYLWKYGKVVGIDYSKKDYIVGVKFEDKAVFDFMPWELKKIQPDEPTRYKKLSIEI